MPSAGADCAVCCDSLEPAMEECCAVCAEPLVWVAYGQCGHREVCYECTARMRFVMEDSRCCICKQDCSSVFVTKALGDYTKVVTDFEGLGEELRRKDKGGTRLWYEDSVQAYFDDEEPFRRIKAMCRLSCSKCEESAPPPPDESLPKGAVKKGHIFKGIESLRRHLFQSHKLIMCELCLKGRKVFVCEQNLFSRSQLDRHSEKGDSEVDGTEEERGGFTGHPMCEFCRKRFYGEHELYQHMSTEHYTCHLCQRARPGHFEYYRNYDDLEMHFRDKHSLCEHPDCLSKKFIVFVSEAELKRHNATTHGGSMSRSQRNAALQIPVVFEFRRPGQASGEGGRSGGNNGRHGYGRGRGRRGNVQFEPDSLDAAVQASVEQAILDDAVRESAAMAASSESAAVVSNGGDTREAQNSFAALSESETDLADGDAPPPSRYASAVSGTGPSTLVHSAFPPLPGGSSTGGSGKGKHKPKNQKGPASMAALLGGGGGGRGSGIRILNTAGSRPPSAGSSSRPSSANGDTRGGGWASSIPRPSSTSSEARPGGWTSVSPNQRPQVAASFSNPEESFPPVTAAGPPSVNGRGATDGSNGSTRAKDTPASGNRVGGVDVVKKLSMEELRAANKALIESVKTGLRGNEQAFADFKDVSARYNRGEMNTLDYYRRIIRLGLSSVVPELGRLCPDPVKGKELIDAHAAQLAREQAFSPVAPSSSSVSQLAKTSSGAGKGKGALEGSTQSSRVSSSGSSRQPPDEEVEVLSKDGYRTGKGKSRLDDGNSSTLEVTEGRPTSRKPQVLVKATGGLLEPSSDSAHQPGVSGQAKVWTCESCTLENQGDSAECVACGRDGPEWAVASRSGKGTDSAGNDKRKKKLSKFQRVRLGDGSAAALLSSVANPNPWGVISDVGSPAVPTTEVRGGFGRGAWANGGGNRLVAGTRKN